MHGELVKGSGLENGVWGSRFVFEDDTVVPSDFKDNYLMNSANKHELGHYLADKFMDFHSSNLIPTLVCTYRDSILSNSAVLRTQTDIDNCISEEADQRIVRHARMHLKELTY